MNITDEFGLIVSERDRYKTENESLKRHISKQVGMIDEGRAQNRQLIARNEKLAARVAVFEKHFYDFHGSAERIKRQKEELEPAPATPPAPEAPNTILGKLSRLGLKTEVAA